MAKVKEKNREIQFYISTFNVRGISKEVKQQQIDEDQFKYSNDVTCLQETKIKDGLEMKNSVQD